MSRPIGSEGAIPPHVAGGTSTRAAEVASFVAAMRVAATPSRDHAAHARRILDLERFVAGTARHRRAYVAALLEAALGSEARGRVRVGLPPREDRLFRGWVDLPMGADGPAPDEGTAVGGPPAHGVADDVDLALRRATAIVRGLRGVPDGSDEAERMWDDMEAVALAPCHGLPASGGRGADGRRVLVILWLVLRRRRPLAAAVLRRCLELDRPRRRGGPGLPSVRRELETMSERQRPWA